MEQLWFYLNMNTRQSYADGLCIISFLIIASLNLPPKTHQTPKVRHPNINLTVIIQLTQDIHTFVFRILDCHKTVKTFFFFKILFIHERYTQRGRDIGRGRSGFPAGSLMQDSIPGPRDHDLSWRQTLNHWATQVPQDLENIKRGNATKVHNAGTPGWITKDSKFWKT